MTSRGRRVELTSPVCTKCDSVKDQEIPDAYEECGRCGKFYYSHDSELLMKSERHDFVRAELVTPKRQERRGP